MHHEPVCAVLRLIFDHVPETVVKRWSPNQRRKAYRYALKARRWAAGRPVQPPRQPEFLRNWN